MNTQNPRYDFEIEKIKQKKLPSMVCEILVIPSLYLCLELFWILLALKAKPIWPRSLKTEINASE
jgi:hypothetical protein